MLITCPHCKSVFKLPDTQNMEQKLRCSLCKTVFKIGDAEYKLEEGNPAFEKPAFENPNDMQVSKINLDTPFLNEQPVKKKSILARVIAILFFAAICFVSILWSSTDYLNPLKEKFFAESSEDIQAKLDAENKRIEELAERVKLLQIQGLRQYTMPNDKIGTLTVIEGKVVNGFDEPRGFVQVECSLFSEKEELLISKKQIAGPSLSLFQLQVLNEEELEQNLNNNIDIMQKNTSINPGATVPFMCVFYNPPQNAANFNIKIISAEKTEDINKQ